MGNAINSVNGVLVFCFNKTFCEEWLIRIACMKRSERLSYSKDRREILSSVRDYRSHRLGVKTHHDIRSPVTKKKPSPPKLPIHNRRGTFKYLLYYNWRSRITTRRLIKIRHKRNSSYFDRFLFPYLG